MTDDVTTGEIYRRLCEMDERYEKTLGSIDAQVRLTNGRTTRLEERVTGINRELRDLKQPKAIVVPEGESLSIKISPKMWAALAALISGLSIFAPMIAKWIAGK